MKGREVTGERKTGRRGKMMDERDECSLARRVLEGSEGGSSERCSLGERQGGKVLKNSAAMVGKLSSERGETRRLPTSHTTSAPTPAVSPSTTPFPTPTPNPPTPSTTRSNPSPPSTHPFSPSSSSNPTN